MARLSTCKGCGIKLAKEDKFTYSSKTYCIKCYEPLKRGKEQYDALIKYICAEFNIEFPNTYILRQIKELYDGYNCSYSGIQYTIWYILNITKKATELNHVIATIKFEYTKAEEYFLQQQKVRESVERALQHEVEEEVYVRKYKKYEYDNKKLLFDIDKLI